MKKLMLGMLVGALSTMAICTAGNAKTVRRTKRAIVNKVEDLLN
jgi:hypothetical protein